MLNEQADGGERTGAFTEALADLKRRGSLILVAGSSQRGLDAACERLLGSSAGPPRQRLYVVGDRAESHHRPLSAPAAGAGRAHSIQYHSESGTRSATATSVNGGSEYPVPTEHVEGDLGELQTAIESATDLLASSGLEAAELRICLDSIDVLLADHDSEAVFSLVHSLSGLVAETRGMCHVHFPAALENDAVQELAPLFDAILEVRDRATLQQRWHVREPDLKTDWLEL